MNRMLVLVTLMLGGGAASGEGLWSGKDLQWYGGVSTGYVFADGDARLAGPTVSVYGGTPTIEMDDSGRFSLVIGAALPSGLRLEGELGYLNLDTKSSPVMGFDDRAEDEFRLDATIESLVFMFKGAYDFYPETAFFRPYVTAGVGIARNDARAGLDVEFNAPLWNGTTFENTTLVDDRFPGSVSTEFAWTAGIGFKLALADRLGLSLEYGITDLGAAATGLDGNGDAIGFDDLDLQHITLGLDYQFE